MHGSRYACTEVDIQLMLRLKGSKASSKEKVNYSILTPLYLYRIVNRKSLGS